MSKSVNLWDLEPINEYIPDPLAEEKISCYKKWRTTQRMVRIEIYLDLKNSYYKRESLQLRFVKKLAGNLDVNYDLNESITISAGY